jgi:hypothetical protein
MIGHIAQPAVIKPDFADFIAGVNDDAVCVGIADIENLAGATCAERVCWITCVIADAFPDLSPVRETK